MKKGPIPAIMTLAFLLLAFLLLPFFGANIYTMSSLLYIAVGAIAVYVLTAYVIKPPTIGLIAVMAVLLLVGMLQIGGLPQLPSGAVGGSQPSQPSISEGVCKGGETPSTLFVGANARTQAANTETGIQQLSGGTGWTAYTSGTAITTFVPGTTYIVVPGDASTTDFIDNAYGTAFSYNANCRDQKTIKLYDDATTFTGTFCNDNDVCGSAASLSASTGYTVGVKAQSAAKTVFGNPYLGSPEPPAGLTAVAFSDLGSHRKAYPNCACMQANVSWFSTSNVRSWLSTGQEMNKIGVPMILTAATGDTSVCFEAPVVTDQAVKQYFYFETSTGAAADDGAIKYYASNYYLNSQTGSLEWGCETDAGAAVGATSAKSITFDVTP